MKRFHAFLSGRVQGINFRSFTQRNAKALGIKGFVKNLNDGRVEVVAEGDEKDLQEFLQLIKDGPRMAHVTDTEIDWEKPEGHTEFRIEY